MANTAFTRAVKKAKTLYKSGRYKTFADAVKSAYKKNKPAKRKKRVGATLLIERNETRRTKPKKVVRVTRTKTGTYKKMQSIGGAKSMLRDHYKSQLANALLKKDLATTKRDKRAYGKKATEARRNLRKIS